MNHIGTYPPAAGREHIEGKNQEQKNYVTDVSMW